MTKPDGGHRPFFTLPRRAIATAAMALAFAPMLALADTTLPAPYVSRALDAVLMPIDASVRRTFDLAKSETGVLVIALDPVGTGAALGLEPGDVIASVGKKRVRGPIMLDEIVYFWIAQGLYDFSLTVWQDGVIGGVDCTITEAMYFEEIEITTVSTWESWEVSEFSYESYYSEYSEEISMSYEESETVIEESVATEEFAEEMTVEDEAVDESTDESVDESTDDDAAMTADGSDEAADEATDDGDDAAMTDDGADEDGAAAEEDVDDAAMTDDGSDEGADIGADMGDDCSVDNSCDDGGDDAADDGGDEGGDDGGDDGGDEGGGDDEG